MREMADLQDNLDTIKYIGPYLYNRFQTESFWPPDSNNLRPLRTKGDLVNFVSSRHITDRTSVNLKLWLTRIMQNERPNQCVEPIKYINNRWCLYHTRFENIYGFNAILQFFRNHIPRGHPIRRHLPRKKTGKAWTTKYPRFCDV